ncbi:hypothetical protein [Pseudomonas sp. DG56-2]|uniref:hypothetical protein n=1 Tax=Pseudomonas sp. DG56-2 TaxID=2320270 RepID=UPI0010A5E6A1|nr:hypothetical protein [Pseudomonas sp. DG56-2]
MNRTKLILTGLITLWSLSVVASDQVCLDAKLLSEELALEYGDIPPARQESFDADYKVCLCAGWRSSRATEMRNAIEGNITRKLMSADRLIEVPVHWGAGNGYIIFSETPGECVVGFVADVDLCEQIDKFEAVINLSSSQKKVCDYRLRQDEIVKTTERGPERNRKAAELEYEFWGDAQPMY